MFTVLFVCTGNTCRSPMAERLLRHIAAEKGLAEKIRAISAGIFACDGAAMSVNSQVVLEKNNIDISDFQATKLTQAHIDRADLVLPMTDTHVGMIKEFFPNADDKTFTLGEFAQKGKNIPDPFGMGVNEYEKCFVELEQMIISALPRIISLAEEDKEK